MTASTNDSCAFGQERVQQYLNTKDSSAYPFTHNQSPEEARNIMAAQIRNFEKRFYSNAPSNAVSNTSSNTIHRKHCNNPNILHTRATR